MMDKPWVAAIVMLIGMVFCIIAIWRIDKPPEYGWNHGLIGLLMMILATLLAIHWEIK